MDKGTQTEDDPVHYRQELINKGMYYYKVCDYRLTRIEKRRRKKRPVIPSYEETERILMKGSTPCLEKYVVTLREGQDRIKKMEKKYGLPVYKIREPGSEKERSQQRSSMWRCLKRTCNRIHETVFDCYEMLKRKIANKACSALGLKPTVVSPNLTLSEVNYFASKLLASAHSLVATIPRPATVIAAVVVSAVSLVANALSPPPPQRHSATTRTV
ncbi:hypothetical protein CRE_24458 [Caenorhabditis remanei]|uniref:Uncharacterized protein n=1 Tax=Caenorhabditis remanei TaxID=31234 RepID=E3MFQ7_CAERE|nr:hypothetical protein CRE_24458 [Caenorhabditis remanei]